MNGSVVVAWTLTVVFLALALPCVLRLVRLDYVSVGQATRIGDVADLVLVLAMVAMLSPIGGPIPAAGWAAVFVVASSWFLLAWWRGRRTFGRGSRRGQCAHHALSAVAMFYMIVGMPHGGATHGPWLTMSTIDSSGRLAWPAVAVAAAAYFIVDGARISVVVGRRSPGAPVLPGVTVWPGLASRAACRSIMGFGMGYLLIAAL